MQLFYRGFRAEPGSPVQEALAALRAHEPVSGRPPYLLGYGPVARMNPYQQLLYRGLPAAGVVSTPVLSLDSFEALLSLAPQASGVGLHLHWLNTVIGAARDGAEAEARVDAFTARLRAFRAADGRLVWTVHNVVPHDAVHIDAERRLQQEVADIVDLVHVMDPATQQVLGEDLRLDPDRLLVAPHPGYQGAYPRTTTREASRAMLGLHSDEAVFAMFGAIKPYKGIEEVYAGFDALIRRDDRPRRLIVAGPREDSRWARELVARLRRHPRVLVQDAAVPNDRMQFLLSAVDVVVLGHRRALNSGGALLGPTFAVPLLAARTGVLPHLLEDSFTEFFEAGDPVSAREGLRSAERLLDASAREAAFDFARRHHPDVVARGFAAELTARLW